MAGTDAAGPDDSWGGWHGQASVAADMTRIFGPAARPLLVGPRPVEQRVRRGSSDSTVFRFGPLLAAGGVVGLLAGLGVVAGADRHAAPRSTASRQEPAPRPMPVESPAPIAAIALAAPSGFAAIAPRSMPSIVPARHAVGRGFHPHAGIEPCRSGSDEACGRDDVLAADAALREAYDDAVDAGVDRDHLVSVRNRWARLRSTAADRPALLVARYDEMAGQLLRSARDIDDVRE